MRLIELELRDVGKFRHFVARLTGRIVGLVGPNGAGKSTLLNAIQYAATGDPARLGDRDAVSITRTGTERPFVRLKFDPGDGFGEATVTRYLPVDGKAATRRLIHNGKSVTGKSDIDAMFEKWTGLAPKALSDFVFVEQGCLTDVVAEGGGRRAEVLQKLFGVSEAETGRALLIDHLSRLPQPADQEVLTTLRVQAAGAEHEVRMAEAELSETEEPDPAAEAADRAIVAAARRGRELAVAAESARYRLAAADAVLSAVPPAPLDRDRLAAAEAIMRDWGAYDGAVMRRGAAMAAQREAFDALTAIEADEIEDPGPEPEPPPDLENLRGKKFTATILAAAGVEHRDCPVCGSPIDGTSVSAFRAVDVLKDLEAAEREYADDLAAWRVAYRKYSQWRARVTAARESAKSLWGLVNAVAVPAPPVIDKSVAAATIAESARAAAALKTYNAARAEAETARVLALEQIAMAEEQNVPSEAELTAADIRLSRLSAAKTRRAAASSSLAAARRARDAVQSTLRKAEELGAAHARTSGWRAVVESAIAILHRDAAPAAAIRSCLADLTTDLNRRLGHLGASFTVVVNADGGLSASFQGSKTVPARRLSGGEKVVLSLAWRLAVLDRYAPDAGLLCLDEPTNHLDEARVAALKDALDAWRPHGTDRQFVIVTHSKQLAKACDQVVTVG